MAIKKYTNGSWVPASYHKYGTETDTITTLPVTIIGDGTPISSYIIKGNMEQSGTPTPSSPIYPSECGEKTENLFDFNANNPDNGYVYGKQLMSDGSVDTFPQANVSEYISITPFSSYTFTYGSQYNDVYAALYNAKREFVRSIRYNGKKEITFYSQEDENYLRFTYLRSNRDVVMLTRGSTALPYEPYGYKLPLTLGSTTTNIYLGEVQTTRRIKKLMFDGTEQWLKSSLGYNAFYFFMNGWYPHPKLDGSAVICNIATFTRSSDNYTRYPWLCVSDNSFGISTDSAVIGGTAVDDWKSYLAAQYAAGTPVTIWYVLAEAETGIVNEPIRKIGDYVDSVSGTSLATSGTAQQFDVGTTLKPSEVDLTYHGWHEHGDTKYST